ncbi:MAG: PAS domain-containing protein [Spirosoma sp.]|nr:PAS domain-containing protein [Spirosoma sp.]
MKADEKILSKNLFPVIGIGASAGGLDAFRKLLRAIPQKSGMAFVLVQHLAPTHESLLPELLQKVTDIPVLEIQDDVKIEPDHIYVLPSNKMLVANDGVLQLSPRGTDKKELNLPIDLFFTSLAEIHQSHAIGVVLSGTGSDGTKGLKAIKENEGITFAQDEASAAHDGMPNSAVQAGVVDFVLPPEEIPKKLVEVIRMLNEDGGDDPDAPEPEKDVFKQILSVLRVRKGTDFTYYKQTTIRRRILRRMAITKTENPADYLTYLRDHKPEQDVLYQDLLIPVTSFFRDHPVFDNLCETVFPLILKNKPAGEPIRIWVAGCSTGQEAYSIAMCLKEFLGNQPPERVQIFASDLSEPAIAKARTGIYAKNEVEAVSPQRLQEFFTRSNGSYQINKSIRDMCVFAVHNFLKDPPFGKLDFISCRNVLIYLEPYLQKKAFTTFHYALNPTGFLLLGKSETVGNVPDLFVLAAKTSKLFTRKDGLSRFMSESVQRSKPPINRATPTTETLRTDFQKIADELILSHYSPAGVVVNEALDIVHFRGITAPYLAQASGKPTHNVLLLAKHGLAFELRNLLHKVRKEQVTVIKDHIPLEVNGSLETISIEALPLPNMVDPHYLILFHPALPTTIPADSDPQKAKTKPKKDDKDLRIAQLERDLAQTREDMRGITQDQEAVNEELQSANEELLSGSEELQSLNEELETGKEELQSTNEELTVVNQEITGLNQQVIAARNYAEAIIATMRGPFLVLDATLRIKTANAAFYTTFKVREGETEGAFLYELGNAQWNIAELRVLLEKILPEKSTITDFEMTHTFPVIEERVMLLNAREIRSETNIERLILLSIEDITLATKARRVERQAQERVEFIANAMPEKVWAADAYGNVTYFNKTWFNYTGLSFEDLKDWGWEKIIHPDDLEETRKRWQHSISTGTELETEHRFLDRNGGYKWHLSRAISQKNAYDQQTLWISTDTEIQEQKAQQEALEIAVMKRTQDLQKANETLQQVNKELEAFTYVSSHDLQEPLRKIQTLASRILDKEHQTLTDSGRDYFGRIQKAAGRMQQLIHDLLAFSQLSTEERIFEITDLSGLVQEVVSELSEPIAEKHATIDATGLGTAPVIVFQFRQLLQNLIGNALKFSNPDVPPHITITSVLTTGGKFANGTLLPEKVYYHLTITDNGIGFDAKYSEKIFEVFQRLHSKIQYTGTGIGLATVQKIVANHNGFITATGELNKGARFDVYLPAA